jgi:membrane fusion protein, multidrug efflux system
MNAKWILIFGLSVLAACSKGSNAPVKAEAASQPTPPPAVNVTAATAELRPLDRIVDVTGSLAPEDTTTISSEVPGRIANIRYDFGQAVRKGDVVVELDKQELQLQVDRMRAALTQSLARLGLDPNASEAPATTATLRQAEAQMEDARSKYENAKKLVETGDVSKERYDELDKQLRARQAAVDVVRDDVRTQWANVQAIRADLKLAEKRLGDAVIRAPFDGVVSQRLVAPGQYVKDNVPLLTLVKTFPLRLNVDIPEVAAAAVRVGTQLDFTAEAIPDGTFHAVVREMNPSLDARSRSLSVQARIVGNNAALKPGMFVQVKLTLAKGQKVLMVPETAITTIAGLTKMFVVREGKAVELHVVPGVRTNGWVEVADAGVNAGDTVATSSLNDLVNGAAISVKKGA